MRDQPLRYGLGVVIAIGVLLLCSCGKKGPLYLPDHPPRGFLSSIFQER